MRHSLCKLSGLSERIRNISHFRSLSRCPGHLSQIGQSSTVLRQRSRSTTKALSTSILLYQNAHATRSWPARFNLHKYFRLSHEVIKAEWIDDRKKWSISIRGPNGVELEDEADIFINGGGILLQSSSTTESSTIVLRCFEQL